MHANLRTKKICCQKSKILKQASVYVRKIGSKDPVFLYFSLDIFLIASYYKAI